MFLKENKTIIEKHLVSHKEMEEAEKFGEMLIIAFAALSLVASVLYIFLKIGTPQVTKLIINYQKTSIRSRLIKGLQSCLVRLGRTMTSRDDNYRSDVTRHTRHTSSTFY